MMTWDINTCVTTLPSRLFKYPTVAKAVRLHRLVRIASGTLDRSSMKELLGFVVPGIQMSIAMISKGSSVDKLPKIC